MAAVLLPVIALIWVGSCDFEWTPPQLSGGRQEEQKERILRRFSAHVTYVSSNEKRFRLVNSLVLDHHRRKSKRLFVFAVSCLPGLELRQNFVRMYQ